MGSGIALLSLMLLRILLIPSPSSLSVFSQGNRASPRIRMGFRYFPDMLLKKTFAFLSLKKSLLGFDNPSTTSF